MLVLAYLRQSRHLKNLLATTKKNIVRQLDTLYTPIAMRDGFVRGFCCNLFFCTEFFTQPTRKSKKKPMHIGQGHTVCE
jgi:hypothetical protein